MRDFFTEGIFSPGISLQNFFPLKSVCTIFFSEITHTPPPPTQKSNGRPTPKHSWDWNSECHWSPKKELQPSVRRQPKLTKDFQSEKILCKPKKFPSSSSFYFMWSLPYGPMKDLHQQTVKREKEWGGGVGMNEHEWASLTTKLSDFGHR